MSKVEFLLILVKFCFILPTEFGWIIYFNPKYFNREDENMPFQEEKSTVSPSQHSLSGKHSQDNGKLIKKNRTSIKPNKCFICRGPKVWHVNKKRWYITICVWVTNKIIHGMFDIRRLITAVRFRLFEWSEFFKFIVLNACSSDLINNYSCYAYIFVKLELESEKKVTDIFPCPACIYSTSI